MVLVQCGDCGVLLKSPEEAQYHGKNTCHTNYLETDEPMCYLVCNDCNKICSCRTESHFHEKRSGHTGGFQDKTAQVVEQERRAREEYNCQKRRQYLQMILQARRRQLLRMPSKAGQMKECLETIKQNHKDDEAKVKAACSVLRRFVENVRRYPDEEKFRKIRISNAAFQEKIGSLLGGIEFLELCGFEKTEGGELLYMPREKVYMEVLNSAEWELRNIE
ncbi:UBX domain-containing protein 6 [Capsicum chacoense]